MLTNKVTNTSTTINQTSISKSAERSVGRLSNYGSGGSAVSITEGQIIKGEVTDLRNKEVSVIMEDNTRVTGTLENGTNLSIGQPAAFKVITVSPRGIILQALPNNYSLSENVTIQKALEEAGLPKTPRNQAIVHELLMNKMSINKQTIQAFLQQSLLHKDISISTLVLMNKLSIPLTEQNAVQFENYRNYEHRLIKEIDRISSLLPDELQQAAANRPASWTADFGSQILSLLQPGDLSPAQTQSNPPAFFSDADSRNELISILENFSLTEPQKEQLLSQTMPLRSLAGIINASMDMARDIDLKNLQSATDAAKETAPDSSPALDLLEIPRTLDAFDSPVVRDVLMQYHDLQKNNGELASFLSLEERNSLLDVLKDFPLSDQFRERILNGEIPVRDVLSIIKNVLSFTEPVPVKNLFESKEFHTVLKESVFQNWTLTPELLQKENAVNEFYQKMHNQLTQMEALMNSADSGSLARQAGQMKENIDFMKTINDIFPYVQLPVKLKNSNIHSELYVYTRKKDLKKHPENISVLLHLDMEYLGPMDIHLTLTNKHVASKFYTSDPEAGNLIETHMPALESALMLRGYTLAWETLKLEKEVDIVSDFLERDSPATSLKRYTFDIRA